MLLEQAPRGPRSPGRQIRTHLPAGFSLTHATRLGPSSQYQSSSFGHLLFNASLPSPLMEDIMYQVFKHLHANVDDFIEDGVVQDVVYCRQALARSARACRAFAYPALAALWRSLPSDEPLLRLLCTLGIAQDSSECALTWPNTDGSLESRAACIPVSGHSTSLRLRI